MNFTTAKADWHLVMAGLRGFRLALYDEMLCNGSADLRTPEQIEAGRWLHYHRFIWPDNELETIWRPRPTAKAKELWEHEGPSASAALLMPVTEPAIQPAMVDPIAEPTPEPRSVHERRAITLELELI